MDRVYVADVLSNLLAKFEACQQQITNSASPLNEAALSALNEFRTVLEMKIDEIANDPVGHAAIDYYGRVAARWIRRFAPGLTAQNIDVASLSIIIEELISTLEYRHADEDRWGDARWFIHDDTWQWDRWTLEAVSEMVSYTLPSLIAKRAAKTLQTMGIVASETLICDSCGHPKALTHTCPYR